MNLSTQHTLACDLASLLNTVKEFKKKDLTRSESWLVECCWIGGVKAALALSDQPLPPAWTLCQTAGRSILTLSLTEADTGKIEETETKETK